MDILALVIVATISLLASAMTLFTGFGLATLLLPVFAIFIDPATAVAAVAVVHLANTLSRLALVGKHADRAVVLRFGLPAIAGAVLGALALDLAATITDRLGPVASYTLFDRALVITPIKLTLGLLIVAFGIAEVRGLDKLAIPRRWMPAGGLISGFFGGLSGHQGALRSAFLLRAGLDRDAFVGTSSVCSVLVDLTRLAVYALSLPALARLTGSKFASPSPDAQPLPWTLIATGCIAAIIGAVVGARLVKKVRLEGLRVVVGGLLAVTGAALALGVV